MANTRDYKEMTVMIEDAEGTLHSVNNLIDGFIRFWKKADNVHLRVQFKLKRRQLVTTWQSQIAKAASSHLADINKARAGVKKPEFTQDTLAKSFVFTYTEDADNVEMVVW